jgi:hypothetical protein
MHTIAILKGRDNFEDAAIRVFARAIGAGTLTPMGATDFMSQ